MTKRGLNYLWSDPEYFRHLDLRGVIIFILEAEESEVVDRETGENDDLSLVYKIFIGHENEIRDRVEWCRSVSGMWERWRFHLQLFT